MADNSPVPGVQHYPHKVISGDAPLDFSGNGGPTEMGTPPKPTAQPQEGAVMRGLRNILDRQPGGKDYRTPKGGQ